MTGLLGVLVSLIGFFVGVALLICLFRFLIVVPNHLENMVLLLSKIAKSQTNTTPKNNTADHTPLEDDSSKENVTKD